MAFIVVTSGVAQEDRRILRFLSSLAVANLMERDGYHGVAAVTHRYRDMQADGEEREGTFLVPNTERDNRLFLLRERTVHGNLEHPFQALPKVVRDDNPRSRSGIIRIWE